MEKSIGLLAAVIIATLVPHVHSQVPIQPIIPGTPCGSFTCINGGQCVTTQTAPIIRYCICPLGFSGPTCEDFLSSPCTATTCLNGGTCAVNPANNAQYCNCPVGFSGLICNATWGVKKQYNVTTVISPLDYKTVPPATASYMTRVGMIHSVLSEIKCCFKGLNDGTSHVVEPPCPINQCLNGGQCVATFANDRFCRCPIGFTQPTCLPVTGAPAPAPATPVVVPPVPAPPVQPVAPQTTLPAVVQRPVCTTQPQCFNGGICIVLSEICLCLTGFTGTNCAVQQLPPVCSATLLCLNGGICTSDPAGVTFCRWPLEFTGARCGLPSPCIPTPSTPNSCLNGGRYFTSLNAIAYCICQPGFSGPTCATPEPPCPVGTCLNGGMCSLAILPQNRTRPIAYCQCPVGFSGARCQLRQRLLPNACAFNPCSILHVCAKLGAYGYSCLCQSRYRAFCKPRRVRCYSVYRNFCKVLVRG